MPVRRGTNLFTGAKPELAKGVIGTTVPHLEQQASYVLGQPGGHGVNAVQLVAQKVLEPEDVGLRLSLEKLDLVLEKLSKVSVSVLISRIVQVRKIILIKTFIYTENEQL
jgi:hypothetical protein